MKKLFLGIFTIAGVLFTSCEKDEVAALDAELKQTQEQLQAGLANVRSQLESAVASLNDAIEAEAVARANGDADLANVLMMAIESLQGLIEAEADARAAGDSALSAELQAAISYLETAIDAESIARAAGDAELSEMLQAAISSLSNLIDQEAAARAAGDASLLSQLNSHVAALNEAISAEAAARLAGDAQLAADIAQAIIDLEAAINEGDEALQAAIDNLQSAIDGINSQITVINANIAALQAAIDANDGDISALQGMLADIQSQIDNLPEDDDSDLVTRDELQTALDALEAAINALSGEDTWEYGDWTGTPPAATTSTSTWTPETAASDVATITQSREITTTIASYEESRTATLVIVGAVDNPAPVSESVTRTIDAVVTTVSESRQIANPDYVPPVVVDPVDSAGAWSAFSPDFGTQTSDFDQTRTRVVTINGEEDVPALADEETRTINVSSSDAATYAYSGGSADHAFGQPTRIHSSAQAAKDHAIANMGPGIALKIFSRTVTTYTASEGLGSHDVTVDAEVDSFTTPAAATFDPSTVTTWTPAFDTQTADFQQSGTDANGIAGTRNISVSPSGGGTTVENSSEAAESLDVNSDGDMLDLITRNVVADTVYTASESLGSHTVIGSGPGAWSVSTNNDPVVDTFSASGTASLGNQVFGGAVKFYDGDFNLLGEPTASAHPVTGAFSLALNFDAAGTYYITWFRNAEHLADNIANSTPPASITITVGEDESVSFGAITN